MDILISLIQTIAGVISALFWSNCVHSSWYVILGNEADGIYWIQVAAVQQIRFSMKYGQRNIYFLMNVALALVMFWMPYNCASQVVPWHYSWDVSELEASPWCRKPLATAIFAFAAWAKVALFVYKLVGWIQKLGWQHQRDDFSSWNTVAIFLIIINQNYGIVCFTF